MDFDVKKDTESPAYLLFVNSNKKEKDKTAEPVESSEDDNENPNIIKHGQMESNPSEVKIDVKLSRV